MISVAYLYCTIFAESVSVSKFSEYLMFSSELIRSPVHGSQLLQFTYIKICPRFQNSLLTVYNCCFLIKASIMIFSSKALSVEIIFFYIKVN